MKKFLTLFWGCMILNLVSAQIRDPKDFIVILDLGPVIDDYRNNIVSVFLNVILKDYLNSKELDEFHLVGMGKEPRLMFREASFSREKVETFLVDLSRVPSIQPPINLIGTLNFVRDYLNSLRTIKSKHLILIMDGKSPGLDLEKTWKEALIKFRQFAIQNGWTFKIVLLPYIGDQPDLDLAKLWEKDLPTTVLDESDEFANKLLGSPRITWPDQPLKVGKSFRLTVKVENFEEQNIVLKVRNVLLNNESALKRPLTLSIPPKSSRDLNLELEWKTPPIEDGIYDANFNIEFEDNYRAFPKKQILNLQYTSSEAFDVDIRFILLIILAIILGVLFVLLIIRLFNHQVTGKRLSRIQAEKRLEKIKSMAYQLNTDRAEPYFTSTSQIYSSDKLTSKSKEEVVTQQTRSLDSAKSAKTSNWIASPDKVTHTSQSKKMVSQASTISFDQQVSSKNQPTPIIKSTVSETKIVYEANKPSGKVFVAEIWTDDYLFQNNIGNRGRFRFEVGEKKVLGSLKGIPIKIMRVPELGELTWDGETLWFKSWVDGFNIGNEVYNCLNKELVWSQPGKMGLHIFIQPYLSEASKFKLFLENLGKTNPGI